MSGLFEAPASVSIARQIEAVERECRMRRQVYPRRVADGRMTQRQAETETAVMEAVLATLRQVERERAA